MSTRSPRPEPLVLSVREAGALLGLGRGASYAAAKRRELPTLRIGRRIVVPKAALDAMLARVTPGRPEEGQ